MFCKISCTDTKSTSLSITKCLMRFTTVSGGRVSVYIVCPAHLIVLLRKYCMFTSGMGIMCG